MKRWSLDARSAGPPGCSPQGKVEKAEGIRWLRAVEDRSAPIPKETTSELGRVIVYFKTVDFEQALGELEAVVERLEQGELPLEEALKQFQRGIELARNCQSSLKQAEQKVEILLRKTPDATPEPFDSED